MKAAIAMAMLLAMKAFVRGLNICEYGRARRYFDPFLRRAFGQK